MIDYKYKQKTEMSEDHQELVPESIVKAFFSFQESLAKEENKEMIVKLDKDFAEAQRKIIKVVEFRKDMENKVKIDEEKSKHIDRLMPLIERFSDY